MLTAWGLIVFEEDKMDKITIETGKRMQEFEINGKNFSMDLDDMNVAMMATEAVRLIGEMGRKLPAWQKSMAENGANIEQTNEMVKTQLATVDAMKKTINTAFRCDAVKEIFGDTEPVKGITQVFIGIAKAMSIGALTDKDKR